MKQNVCGNCGELNSSDAKFCTSCGEKLEEQKVIIDVKPEEKEEQKQVGNSKKTIDSNIFGLVLTAIITFIVTLGGCFIVYVLFNEPITNEIIKEQRNVTVTDTGIADAVEKVYDAVVVIKTYKSGQLYSTGTGFVFEKDEKNAYILTNAHVVNGGDKFTATFTNDKEKEVDVKLVGSDTYSDTAVVSVPVDKIIKVAVIGSSEDLRIGDTTFAVGAPIDSDAYSWTVTRGILSGKNREVEVNASGNNYFANDAFVMEVLQTDTPINSGNSGGPLCNANGEVIGVANMKISSNQVEGIGFAIPIETAISYATDFINGEGLDRPYLGIAMYYVSPTSYYQYKADVSGVYVDTIEEKSPADKAGIKKGDIITHIDGKEIKSVAYFKYLLYKYEVGDTVPFTVVRNGKNKTIKITLGTSNTIS